MNKSAATLAFVLIVRKFDLNGILSIIISFLNLIKFSELNVDATSLGLKHLFYFVDRQ